MDWIERTLRDDRTIYAIDGLNSDFVNAYIDATGASFKPTNYGAHKCPQMGRDLAKMAEDGILTKSRVGINGMGMGFPTWVFSYRLRFG